MKLLGQRIAVIQDETEDVTPGGVILPSSAKAKLPRGVVKAVADDVKDIEVEDRVIFDPLGSKTVTLGGQELLILHEDEVLVRGSKRDGI